MFSYFRLLFVYFEKIIDSRDTEFNEYSYANRRKGTLTKNIEGIIVSISAFVLVNFRTKLQKLWLLKSVLRVCVFVCLCVAFY